MWVDDSDAADIVTTVNTAFSDNGVGATVAIYPGSYVTSTGITPEHRDQTLIASGVTIRIADGAEALPIDNGDHTTFNGPADVSLRLIDCAGPVNVHAPGTINGWGTNDGDPAAGGAWNRSGYEGAMVRDTTNGANYIHLNGG